MRRTLPALTIVLAAAVVPVFKATAAFGQTTDSHATKHLGFIKYGVQIARRGWLEKADVLTTLPFEKLQTALRPKQRAAHKEHAARS